MISTAAVLLINLLVFWTRHAVFAAVAFAGHRLGLWRRIQPGAASRSQILREIASSAVSAAVFVVAMALLLAAAARGHTRIYRDIATYGVTWFFASIACCVLVHDAYFYWTHRLMHERRAFRNAHRLHHTFTSPTPWFAFSFHPGEALIEAGVLPLIAWTIPVHPLALFLFTSIMTAQSVAIHSGLALSPVAPSTALRGGWWLGSRAHDAHHRGARGNFGLYFTLWDLSMGTYSARETLAPQPRTVERPETVESHG